jgi:NPCBM/NEW2 domain/Aspartyl protease
MKNRFVLNGPGVLLCLVLICLSAMEDLVRASLPAEVTMNKLAGRGGLLVVTLRLENGQELPFIVDTGTSGTLIDTSLEPKLGKPLGTAVYQSWGVKVTNNVYAAPKLYLGGVPLKMTGPAIVAYDLKKDSSAFDRTIMGILGMDVLEHYCIQLDFAAGKMRFLDDASADKHKWGKAFPIVALNSNDSRPAVAYNLLGLQGPHSLIDSGCDSDGWLMPKYFGQWTNQAVAPPKGEARSPNGYFDGEKYLFVSLARNDVESDGIGLRFLARHLVTLDFPDHTLYLKHQSIGPLPDPRLKTTPIPALELLISDVLQDDVGAARRELAMVEHGRATELEKRVARNLEATLEDIAKPSPADVPPSVERMPLGDCRPELAEVGWLKPAANRIPLNGEIVSPLLDSGKIYATGLFAHSPSRYVYNLDGKWKTLRGEAGLHTAFQNLAYGVVFVIKTDGKEVFRSGVVRGSEHPLYDVDVTGVKTLELVAEKAQEQNGGDWGLWLEPTLFR